MSCAWCGTRVDGRHTRGELTLCADDFADRTAAELDLAAAFLRHAEHTAEWHQARGKGDAAAAEQALVAAHAVAVQWTAEQRELYATWKVGQGLL